MIQALYVSYLAALLVNVSIATNLRLQSKHWRMVRLKHLAIP